jgi:hypothetical protein
LYYDTQRVRVSYLCENEDDEMHPMFMLMFRSFRFLGMYAGGHLECGVLSDSIQYDDPSEQQEKLECTTASSNCVVFNCIRAKSMVRARSISRSKMHNVPSWGLLPRWLPLHPFASGIGAWT